MLSADGEERPVKCPADGTVLAMSERRGVEIDYCPQCRGVWLDRGELDKLIERAAEEVPEPPRREERDERRDYVPPRHDDAHRKKKKKSFLSEFLEFGD